jgi:hypothetical protein
MSNTRQYRMFLEATDAHIQFDLDAAQANLGQIEWAPGWRRRMMMGRGRGRGECVT